ncbi:hypothetical protein [Lysobacter terrae]
MELLIAVIALAVALWQLKLQRDEATINSRIGALIHVADLLMRRIDDHERIIDALKAKRKDWQGHATYVNNELRPLLAQTNTRLLVCLQDRLPDFDAAAIRRSLRLGEDQEEQPSWVARLNMSAAPKRTVATESSGSSAAQDEPLHGDAIVNRTSAD